MEVTFDNLARLPELSDPWRHLSTLQVLMLPPYTRGPPNVVVLTLHSPGLDTSLIIVRDKADTLLAPLGTA